MFSNTSIFRLNTRRFGKRQRQWLWFVGLAAGGMIAMLLLAGLVKAFLAVAA